MADRDAGDTNAAIARGRDRRATRDGSPVASGVVEAVVALAFVPSGRPTSYRR
jgi:hypothetical protein